MNCSVDRSQLISVDNKQSESIRNNDKLKPFFISIYGTIIILDNDYRYKYVNENALKLANLKNRDLLGKKIWDKFPDLIGTAFEKNVNDAIQNREIRRFRWPGVYQNLVLEFVIAPVDEGLIISCEERAVDTIESNEDKYRYLVEYAPVGICEIDPLELCFKSVNKTLCKVLGYLEEELLDKSITNILDEDKSRFEARIKRGIAGEKLADPTEYRLIAKDGRRLWAVLDMQLTYDDGKLDSVLVIVHDVTERKQMQAALEGYSKNLELLVEERTKQLKNQERLAAIGSIAGMVGHDVRNPLQAIISDVYLLKDCLTSLPESKLKEDAKESIDSIDKNIGYINKIIADLQDYSRPLNPEYCEVDLHDLIVNIFQTIVIPDNIKLSIGVKAFPKIKTDPTFIRRALTNLVNNAIQAMPNGGKLELAGFEEEHNAYLTVSDTGVGIPEEVKSKLFTPMITTKAKGQGLGLAVVKRLIEALNGTITLETEVGKGTKFAIKLPEKK